MHSECYIDLNTEVRKDYSFLNFELEFKKKKILKNNSTSRQNYFTG